MVSIQQQCCTTNSHGLLTPKTHLIEINFRPFGVGVGVGVGVGNVILVLLPGAPLEPDPIPIGQKKRRPEGRPKFSGFRFYA